MHTDKRLPVAKQILADSLSIPAEQVTTKAIWFFFDQESDGRTWTQKPHYEAMVKVVKKMLDEDPSQIDDMDTFLKSLPSHAKLLA